MQRHSSTYDSSSYVKYITSMMHDISKIIVAATNISPLASHVEKTSKRYISDAMDTEEEDTARTPKR